MLEPVDYFPVLKNYCEAVIKPNLQIEVQNYGYSGNNGTITLPNSFSAYEQTEYFYKGVNKFIHFTSFENLSHIINSNYFIASQLSSLDDPLELIFAGHDLMEVITEKQLHELKKYLFSFSMCEYNQNSDSYNMWNMYGKNGYGIGIVFSFYDNIKKWNGSFLSNVHYGRDNSCLDKFKNISQAHNSFTKEHPEITMLSNIGGINGITDDVALLLSFHKSHLYLEENEVRYLKSFLHNSHETSLRNDSMGVRINKKHKVEEFYKLPIVSKKNIDDLCNKTDQQKINNFQTEFIYNKNIISTVVDNNPFVILETIILGYRYTDKELETIKKGKIKIIEKLNSGLIEFQLSNVSKEFYGK
ncbi:MAG: DUF2971 domain-containing protein [Ginsengibacter sp.]